MRNKQQPVLGTAFKSDIGNSLTFENSHCKEDKHASVVESCDATGDGEKECNVYTFDVVFVPASIAMDEDGQGKLKVYITSYVHGRIIRLGLGSVISYPPGACRMLAMMGQSGHMIK